MTNGSIWFYVEYYRGTITPVTVIKETAQQVVLWDTRWGRGQERRAFKVGSSDTYHPTFAEAKAALVARYANKVKNAEEALTRAQGDLQKAEVLIETPAPVPEPIPPSGSLRL